MPRDHSQRPRTLNRAPASRVDATASLLGRRDIVLTPFVLVILLGSSFVVSIMLRAPSTVEEPRFLMTVGVVLATTGAVLGGTIHLLWGRVRLTPIVAGALYIGLLSGLGVVISVVAIHDGGFASVSALSFLVLGAYVALVAPHRLVVPGLAAILAMLSIVGAIGGTGPPHTAPVLAMTVIAGFIAGRLPRVGQELVARRATRAARRDELTGLLNRRGFEDETDFVLAAGNAAGLPVALLMIDLNAFKLVNDAHGHAAGDALLTWVGARLCALAQPDAVVARVGGDEFAILLPNTSEAGGEAAGASLRAALAERVGASVGVAARADGATDRPALVRAADKAMYRAKSDPTRGVRVQAVTHAAVPPTVPPTAPAITFAALRTGPPGFTPVTTADPQWILHAHLVMTISGALVILGTWIWGGDTPWEVWLRGFGPVWTAAGAAWALHLYRHPIVGDRPAWWRIDVTTVLAALGIMALALANGGSLTPVAGAFCIAVLHDTSMLRARDLTRTNAIFVGFWLATVLLSPAGSLWAVPFQAALFVTAFALGWVGRRMLEDSGREEHRLATIDPLTGLLNRRAFVSRVEQARANAPQSDAAVLAVDLDGFKAVNDRFGHAVGDQVLADVAQMLRTTLGDRWAVGRLGGDEFVAFGDGITPGAARFDADRLSHAMSQTTAGSVGVASFGPDGDDFCDVSVVADRRSYARKRDRRAIPRESADRRHA